MVNHISTVQCCCMQKRGGYSRFKNFRAVLIPLKSPCAVLILRGCFFNFNFQYEFEFIFVILLGHESGPQGV